jgi:hypothetical protein
MSHTNVTDQYYLPGMNKFVSWEYYSIELLYKLG